MARSTWLTSWGRRTSHSIVMQMGGVESRWLTASLRSTGTNSLSSPDSFRAQTQRSCDLISPGKWLERWPCRVAPCWVMQPGKRIGWLPSGWWCIQRRPTKCFEPMYQGLAMRYNDAGEEKSEKHHMTRFPQPTDQIHQAEKVLQHFSLNSNRIPLFITSMLKTWLIQGVHILCGCLSGP